MSDEEEIEIEVEEEPVKATKPKRVMSELQLANLAKARQKAQEAKAKLKK